MLCYDIHWEFDSVHCIHDGIISVKQYLKLSFISDKSLGCYDLDGDSDETSFTANCDGSSRNKQNKAQIGPFLLLPLLPLTLALPNAAATDTATSAAASNATATDAGADTPAANVAATDTATAAAASNATATSAATDTATAAPSDTAAAAAAASFSRPINTDLVRDLVVSKRLHEKAFVYSSDRLGT